MTPRLRSARHRSYRWLLATLLAGAAFVGAAASVSYAKGPQFTRTVLSNGAILLVSEQHGVPMVVSHVLIDAGARRDPDGLEGLAALTADLLTEGTRRHSAPEMSAAVDRLGASLESASGIDSAYVSLKVLRKHWQQGLDLMLETLLEPAFAAEEIERRRESVLASLRAAEDQPTHVANRVFTETLFAGEPYGHLADGTAATVSKLRRAELLAFYREHYRPTGAIITVVGDVEADAVRAELESRLAPWSPGAPAEFRYPPAAAAAARVVVVAKPVPQTSIVLGHRGIARDDPDYYAVTLMNFILGGGGFGSRLLDDIRTRAGLAYSVGSSFSAPKGRGSFRVEMQTKTASAREAIDLACTQIDRIRREEVSDAEIEDAKLYLTGSFPLQFDSNGEIAGFLSAVEFYQLGASYADDYLTRIQAVTKADILRVAQSHLRPQELLLVVVGAADAAMIGAEACRAAADS